ncbi:MAG: HAD family hydrolase [Pseudomonadota bacterium]
MTETDYSFVRRHFIDPAPRWRDLRYPLPAVFLDRDGVVNEEVDYLSKVEDLALIPGTAAAIARLNDAGVPVIIITNQSGVARGMLSEDGLRDLHEALIGMLAQENASIQGIYYSPYHPDGLDPYDIDSPCRKPGPAMLHAAAQEFAINLQDSIFIGDKTSDLEAAQNAGAHGVMVRTGHGAVEANLPGAAQALFVADDLASAVDRLFADGFIQA